MGRIVNVLAVAGSLFLFGSFFNTALKDVLLNIGFLIWAIMNVFNAKIYHDKGEPKKMGIILACAVVLFCVSARGLWIFFLL